ncbi:ribonuclease R [Idiomarina sp. 29L]|uniref:ribonuclease R n=1 Tax=Idiomarina sp. 29L TaxID=2508877 RepID=UPI0010129856|nr:ribonuclease R [Idiomarina sp. 29L]RXS42334.1 ribonuclease R [Idiomarina sp. 29L]
MSDNKTMPEYEVEIPSREQLLQLVKDNQKPVPFDEFIRVFKLDDERQSIGLKRRLRAMERDGQLIYSKANAYGLPERMDLIKGRIIGHKDGFGFCQPDEGGPDLFIPHHQMYSVLHGDRVLVKKSGKDSRGKTEGRIVRVTEPRDSNIVGRYFIEHDLGIVVPDDNRISQDILIPDADKNGARHGQLVVVEITRRPSRRTSPIGRVTEVLGEHMAPGMEIEVAIREHDIPNEWPQGIDNELSKYSEEVPKEAYEGRVDLRELPLITIDGADSRDFDDAVCCMPEEKGWRLWVAIADVSYYVRPDTALDKSATERGNSVYFPNNVIPMLPEKLSNGLCSLNPDVDRLCMVAEMELGPRGKLKASQFYPAVMKSHARLTYDKVKDILDGDKELREQYEPVLGNIEELRKLYNALSAARKRRSAIEFDTQETRFIFNAQRKIERIEPVKRHVAHKIIEECMIMANVAAAQLIESDKEVGALFRVHETPSDERLTSFRTFLGELGLNLGGGEEPTPRDYAKLLDEVKDRQDHELIETMLLRSMQQAVYQPDNKGHFGLALKSYAHFTSPIRRYPDLILHRAIKSILRKQSGSEGGLVGAWTYSETQLDELGVHTSMTERRADDATRQVDEWLKCEFMLDHIGMEFDGVISSVTNFGLFIRLSDYQIDGLVHISNLDNDYYHFDQQKGMLIGENSRSVFRLGDSVKVKVKDVNLDDRKIDLTLLEATSPSGKKRDMPKKGSGKPKGNRSSKNKRGGQRKKTSHNKNRK